LPRYCESLARIVVAALAEPLDGLAEVRGDDESELVGERHEDDGASEDVPPELSACGDAGAEWPSYE
jgi:hypothetical protein